jgi:acetyl-CoA carboxylase biotin carboxylase subunit
MEFQVMADSHGSCLWLGERECSVQRRHQKIVEETPSPALTPEMRREMGDAAVRLASAAGYRGAGTVEFLLEADKFHFLEVNARLQVEHPVTEMVTGRDLVLDQLRIAAGEPLGYEQEDIQPRGSAIELRIYAEDPDNNFFPSPGIIGYLEVPSGPGIRHDCGVTVGSEVTLHYDPLIAKLIAWAPDRDSMISRIRRALEEYQITGVTTILPFLREVLSDEAFRSGQYDTHLVAQMMGKKEAAADDPSGAQPDEEGESAFLAAVAAAIYHGSKSGGFASFQSDGSQRERRVSRWVREGRELREWLK